ncbi:hypothetical protein [Rhodohalobacter sp. 8-1]|uniref:hypothetical protein n=1 Tax=Rhodohalobacter sp. 8-1 TaxID=3131972 RepID=UPI0030ED9F4A
MLNAKNLVGWRTKRKIIVISVDDYGNVRLDSKKAREVMDSEGMIAENRFDALDTLETRTDLEMLFETLSSVKDKHGRHAIFTPFAMPCNINFEQMAEEDYEQYRYENLPQTYEKLEVQQPEAYKNTWPLWREGMKKGLMVPLFHGREHLNLKLFEEKLQKRDQAVMVALKNRSYTSISSVEYSTISPMAAFDFWEFDENERFHKIIRDGLDQFEAVYGYRSNHFNPPGGREHPVIHSTLKECGVNYIDTPLIKREHQGQGRYKKEFNFTGKKNNEGQIFLVRNVVFEPTEKRGINWVDFTLKQVEAAFRWNRPAIISSHRVNFCGHIDPENREEGLNALRELLNRITERWPEVEFMAANELGDLVAGKQD